MGSTARALLPALRAGLPGRRATVCVGPPLLARGPSAGSATLNWLPVLLPPFRPPLPPVPKRLNALVVLKVPLASLGVEYDDVGVRSDRKCSLPRVETEEFRRVRRNHLDEP